jgi:hypothetical protein
LPADRAVTAGNAIEMGMIDDALAATADNLVNRDLANPMSDTDLAGRDRHGNTLADQPPWHRVAVGIDLNRTVVAHDA